MAHKKGSREWKGIPKKSAGRIRDEAFRTQGAAGTFKDKRADMVRSKLIIRS